MVDPKELPTSRLGRLARMAAVGARAGVGMITSGDGSGAAKHAAEVLGTMRGLAAKLGQAASYVDGVIPEGQREAYETAMKALRSQAPRSSPEAVRALVETELGAPIDKLFSRWDEAPIASASIGQVHRAQLDDGREVAVKVQHPGIAGAMESDLANAGILEGFAGFAAGPRIDVKQIFAVVRERLREELDYRLEGERLTQFAKIHADDAQVRIPDLIPERSSRQVLTTTFAAGRDFDEACAASVEEREAWAATMWRYVFRGTLVGGLLNADPHPGNYIFHEDGAVSFLDYGCVQAISDERRGRARKVHRAALAHDEAGFRSAVGAMVEAKPGRLEVLASAYTRRCFEPLFASPYRITRGYAGSLVDGMKEMAAKSKSLPVDEFFDMPPDMVFVNRLQFGFYSVLARLDVEVDYARVERSFLGDVD
jgi:predicted unusual protein kinase regulating ubiquinone biosynthesis (AarF/ABC1/UbiB family)